MLSDEQAEPEWTAMPARSNPMSTGSASTPCTPRHTSWGSLASALGPTTVTPSTTSAAPTRVVICWRAAAASVASAPVLSAGQRRRRRPEGEQGRERLEPGPAPAFLFPSHEEGFEPAPTPHDQRTGTGHPTELVRADADQVGVERSEVRRDVPAGGGGVHVDGDAGLPAQCDNLVHGLERPDLVVAPLAVHQRRAREGWRVQALPQRLDLEPPRTVDADVLGGRQARRGVPDRRVLHRRAEHGHPRGRPRRTPDGGVDGLGRPRGEDHLASGDADELGDLATGHLQRVADGATLFVHPSGIPCRQGRPLRQCGDGLGSRRGGAGVIEIGAPHAGSGRGGAGVVAPRPRGEDHREGLSRRACRKARPATP